MEVIVDPEMVASLCRLAVEFQNEANDLSMPTLISRTGYSKSVAISEEALETYLRLHPELVISWLLESKNTRGTPAWYLLPPKSGSEWIVSHYPSEVRHQFPDQFKACAFYVRHFVMQLTSVR
jgi:hypothetical protein